MTVPAVFHVPRLHPEYVPARMRERALFVPCGLSDSFAASGDPDSAREAIRRLLPFGPAESRAVLEELLRLGEEHAFTGILRQVNALRLMEDGKRGERTGELGALASFAASGVAAGSVEPTAGGGDTAAPNAVALRQMLMDSQKLLLLAYALEERMLELEQLESRFLGAEASLHAALGEGDAEDLQELERQGAPLSGGMAESLAMPISWQSTVEAMLPFLPDKAMLFTADTQMIEDLQTAELLRPLSEDKAALLSDWPEEILSSLSYVCLPAWRLLGRRSCPVERPWLSRECEVFAMEAASETSV